MFDGPVILWILIGIIITFGFIITVKTSGGYKKWEKERWSFLKAWFGNK